MNQNNNELEKAVIEQWKMPASQVAITFARQLGDINGDKMETGSMSAKYFYRLRKSLLKAIISGELRAREHITGEYLEPGHDAYSDGDIDLQDFCNWANKAGFIGVPDDGLELAAAFGLPREAYLSESQQALPLKIQATTSPAPERQATPVGAVIASGGVVTDKAGPVTVEIGKKRRGWRDITWPYLLEVFQSGNYSTAKDFYQALERKAGADSPFELGTGLNRGSLFIRQINQTFSLKTVQNYAWKELRESR